MVLCIHMERGYTFTDSMVDQSMDFGRLSALPPQVEFAAVVNPEAAPLTGQEYLDKIGMGHKGEQTFISHDGKPLPLNKILESCPHFVSAIEAHRESDLEMTDDEVKLARSLDKFIDRTIAPPAEQKAAIMAAVDIEKKNY